MPPAETDRQDMPTAPIADADEPSQVHQKIKVMAFNKCNDAHDSTCSHQPNDLETHCESSPSPDKNDNESIDDSDEDKHPSIESTRPTTFPFMRLPLDIRLCVYDHLAAMPVYRAIPGEDPKWIYYTAPSVGILNVSKLIRQEAYSITERGHIQMCPSITFRLLNPDSEGEWSNLILNVVKTMVALVECIEYIGEQDAAHDVYRFAPFEPRDICECGISVDQHGTAQILPHWHCIIIGFLMWTSSALHRGSTLAIRLIMDNSYFRDGYDVLSHSSIVGHFIRLQLACPPCSSVTLQLLVPADRVARVREIFGAPDSSGRFISAGTWKVDALEGDADSSE